MRGWYAVFCKETANFFVSPIAYAVIAVFSTHFRLLLLGQHVPVEHGEPSGRE